MSLARGGIGECERGRVRLHIKRQVIEKNLEGTNWVHDRGGELEGQGAVVDGRAGRQKAFGYARETVTDRRSSADRIPWFGPPKAMVSPRQKRCIIRSGTAGVEKTPI